MEGSSYLDWGTAKFTPASVSGVQPAPYVAAMLELTTLTTIGAWHDGGGWHHGHLWIWMLLWGLVLALVFPALWRSRRAPRPCDTARTILAERYAKGEITPEEYRERLATLGEKR